MSTHRRYAPLQHTHDAAGGGAITDYGGMYDDTWGYDSTKAAWIIGQVATVGFVPLNNANLSGGANIWVNGGGNYPLNGTANNVSNNTTNGTITLEAEGLWEIDWMISGDTFSGGPTVGIQLWEGGTTALAPVTYIPLQNSYSSSTSTGTCLYDNTGNNNAVIDIRGAEMFGGITTLEINSAYLFAKRIA